jgi:hypothetical protein
MRAAFTLPLPQNFRSPSSPFLQPLTPGLQNVNTTGTLWSFKLMIRFAPQAARQPVVPQPGTRPAVASEPVAKAEPLTSLLPADFDAAPGAVTAKSAKPRAAKKQKVVAESAAVQLDLDA